MSNSGIPPISMEACRIGYRSGGIGGRTRDLVYQGTCEMTSNFYGILKCLFNSKHTLSISVKL